MIAKKFIEDNFKDIENIIEIDGGFRFECNYNLIAIVELSNNRMLICTHKFSSRDGDSVEVYSENELLNYFSNIDSYCFLKS